MPNIAESIDAARMLALEARGIGRFIQLASSGTVARFRKVVLPVGHWVHPETGQIVDVSREDLVRIADDTNRWLSLGHKVWFPARHSDDPRDNLGTWLSFFMSSDGLEGIVEVPNKAIADQVGSTITDVSAGIQSHAMDSATGETFNIILAHVAATPCPVIPKQTNFIPLARAAEGINVTTAVKLPTVELSTKPDEKKPEIGQAAPPVIKLDLSGTLRQVLGLAQDANDETIAEVVKKIQSENAQYKTEEVMEGSDHIVALSKKELTKKIADLETVTLALKKKSADREIELARQESVRAGVPIDQDTINLASEHFMKGEDAKGLKILDLAVGRARDRALLSTSVQTLENPGASLEKKADEERQANVDQMLKAVGMKRKD